MSRELDSVLRTALSIFFDCCNFNDIREDISSASTNQRRSTLILISSELFELTLFIIPGRIRRAKQK